MRKLFMLVFLCMLLFISACASLPQIKEKLDTPARLEACFLINDTVHISWRPYIYPEICFYEAMDGFNPEEVLNACAKLEKPGKYDLRSECFNVLIQKFKSEELLSELLKMVEDKPKISKIEILGFYGDPEKCSILKKDFNITVDGKPVFSFYDKCVELTEQADERTTIWEAIIQKNTQLCQNLRPISRNICLFYIADETNNAEICDSINSVSESGFTYKNYCKCRIENPSEPSVGCIDIGNIFDPERNARCVVKKGQEIIAEETPKNYDVQEFKMRYAPCQASWQYSSTRQTYDDSIFWATV